MPLRVSRGVRVVCDFEMQPSLIVYLSICVIPYVRSRPTFACSSHVPLISRKRNSSHFNLRLISFHSLIVCLLRSAFFMSDADLQPPYNGKSVSEVSAILQNLCSRMAAT